METKWLKKDIFTKKNISDIDVTKILASKEEPFGINGSIKYFIEYSDNDVFRPLCIMLPQMIRYAKHFEINKTVSSKISVKKVPKYGKELGFYWIYNLIVKLFMVIIINT